MKYNKSIAPTMEGKIKLTKEKSKDRESDIPQEYLEMIKERFRKIDNGEAELMDWDEVKKKFIRFE